MYISLYHSISTLYPPQHPVTPSAVTAVTAPQGRLGLFLRGLGLHDGVSRPRNHLSMKVYTDRTLVFIKCISVYSIDWFKGKNTGTSHISWENPWFPIDFPSKSTH